MEIQTATQCDSRLLASGSRAKQLWNKFADKSNRIPTVATKGIVQTGLFPCRIESQAETVNGPPARRPMWPFSFVFHGESFR